MPAERDTGVIDHGLLHGSRHQRLIAAIETACNGSVQRRQHPRHVARLQLTRDNAGIKRMVQNRELSRGLRRRIGVIVDLERYPQALGAFREHVGISHDHPAIVSRLACEPHDQIRADPRRFAGSNSKALHLVSLPLAATGGPPRTPRRGSL